MNHDTMYYTNPAEPERVKGVHVDTYVRRYKKMVNMALEPLMMEPYSLTPIAAKNIGNNMALSLELKTNAFSFKVLEVFGEGSLGNGKTVRNDLCLGGHSVGSFVHWVLACQEATDALWNRTAMSLYTYKRQSIVGRDANVGPYWEADKLNAPAVFLLFEYGVLESGTTFAMANVKLDGHTDRLELLGMDEIPLPTGMFRPKGQAGTHCRALTHSVAHAPFTLILSGAVHVASFVEENHCVHFGQQDFS